MAFNPITYLKESKAEFDKVNWPSKMETVRLTFLVLVVSVIVGAYIAGLDAIFTSIVDRFLR